MLAIASAFRRDRAAVKNDRLKGVDTIARREILLLQQRGRGRAAPRPRFKQLQALDGAEPPRHSRASLSKNGLLPPSPRASGAGGRLRGAAACDGAADGAIALRSPRRVLDLSFFTESRSDDALRAQASRSGSLLSAPLRRSSSQPPPLPSPVVSSLFAADDAAAGDAAADGHAGGAPRGDVSHDRVARGVLRRAEVLRSHLAVHRVLHLPVHLLLPGRHEEDVDSEQDDGDLLEKRLLERRRALRGARRTDARSRVSVLVLGAPFLHCGRFDFSQSGRRDDGTRLRGQPIVRFSD